MKARSFVFLALLLVLPALAYSPYWWEGRLLGPGDGAALHYTLRSLVWDAYRGGELPAWNPTIFLGTPLLAAYRPGALFPAMPVLALLPSFAAFQALVLVSLAAAGTLVFFYVRRLGAEPVGAYVAGLCFALGPYLVGHVDDTATLVAAPMLPLVLLAAEAHISRGGRRRAAALAVSIAFLLLAGSPEAARAGLVLLAARPAVADPLAYVRTSSQKDRAQAPSQFHPLNLLDEDPATVWCELPPGVTLTTEPIGPASSPPAAICTA